MTFLRYQTTIATTVSVLLCSCQPGRGAQPLIPQGSVGQPRLQQVTTPTSSEPLPSTRTEASVDANHSSSLPICPPTADALATPPDTSASAQQRLPQSPAPCAPTQRINAVKASLQSDYVTLAIDSVLEDKQGQEPCTASSFTNVRLWPQAVEQRVLSLELETAKGRWTSARKLNGNVADRMFSSSHQGIANQQARALELGTNDGPNHLRIRPWSSGDSIRVRYQVLLKSEYWKGVHTLSLPDNGSGGLPQFTYAFPKGGRLLESSAHRDRETLPSPSSLPVSLRWQPERVGLEAELLRFISFLGTPTLA